MMSPARLAQHNGQQLLSKEQRRAEYQRLTREHGMRAKDAAERIGITTRTAATYEHEITAETGIDLATARRRLYRDLRAAGLSPKPAARLLGISNATAYTWNKELSMTTDIHDGPPEPESDLGLTPDPQPILPDPAVLESAHAAFWAAADGTGFQHLPAIPFYAAIAAAIAVDRGRQAAKRILDQECTRCSHTRRDHADPDACMAPACSCSGFTESSPIRGGLLCLCGHADVLHDLKAGERGACPTATGHTGAPCECKKYVPQEEP